MKNFVLIGAAGYIAPRHMKAIKETGNNLVAALDPHDAVGVLDQYFPDCDFFTEFERFDRHCEKLKRQGTAVDYVVVCSPNYLHDAHIRFGLRIGADVICEKPVVLNPWNLEALMEMEKETGRKVYVVHQLRYHPEIIKLRERVLNGPSEKVYKVELTYITPRGKWYEYSWKGDVNKSGGILTNIGLHFFDLLIWIFGGVIHAELSHNESSRANGTMHLKNAIVRWTLSIHTGDLPKETNHNEVKPIRVLNIDGENVKFEGFQEELHVMAYNQILNDTPVRLPDARDALVLISELRKNSTAYIQ